MDAPTRILITALSFIMRGNGGQSAILEPRPSAALLDQRFPTQRL